jgi:hypothetical protein
MINSKIENSIKSSYSNKLILKKIFKSKNNNSITEIQVKIIDTFLQENFNFINYNIIKELDINSQNYYLFKPFHFFNPNTNNIIIFFPKEVNNEFLIVFYIIYENNFSKDLLIIETLANILGLEEISNYELYFKDYEKIALFTQYLNKYNLNISQKELDLSKKIITPDFINIINSIFNQNPIELNENNLLYLQELENINFLKILFIFKCSVKNEFIFQTNNVNNLKSVINTFLCPYCKKPLKNEIIDPKFEISIFFERFINNSIWLKNIIIEYLLSNFSNNLKIYEYTKDIMLIDINSILFFIFIINLNNSNLINYFSYIKDMEVLNIASSFFVINPISNHKLVNEKFINFNLPNSFIIYFDKVNYNNFINKMDFIKEIINNKIFEKNINEIIINFDLNNYINYISLISSEKTKEDLLSFEKSIPQELGEKEREIESITINKTVENTDENIDKIINEIQIEKTSREILSKEKISSQLQTETKVNQQEIENITKDIDDILAENIILNKSKEEKTIDNKIIESEFKKESPFDNIQINTKESEQIPTQGLENLNLITSIENTNTNQLESTLELEIKSEEIKEEIKEELKTKSEPEYKFDIELNDFISKDEKQLIDIMNIDKTIEKIETIEQIEAIEEKQMEEKLTQETLLEEKVILNKYELVNNYINSISFKETNIFTELYSLKNIKIFNEIFNTFILLFAKEGKNNFPKVIQDILEFSKSKSLLLNTLIILYSNKLTIFPKNIPITNELEIIFNKLSNIKENITSKKFELLLIYDKLSFYSFLNISSLILGVSFLKEIEFNWINNFNVDNKEIFIKYKKEVIEYIDNYIKEMGIENYYIMNKDWEILNEEKFSLVLKEKIINELKLIYKLFSSCILPKINLNILVFKISDKYNLLLNFKNIIIIIEISKLDIELINNIIHKLSVLELL